MFISVIIWAGSPFWVVAPGKVNGAVSKTVWCGALNNSGKWKDWEPEDMFCPLSVLSDVPGWEKVLNQVWGGRWKPSPIPSQCAQLSGLLHPQTEPEPCRDEQGRAGPPGSLPTSPESLYRTSKTITSVVQGLGITCLQQGAEVALKSAKMTEKGAKQPVPAWEQSRHRTLSFRDASQDRLFWAAPYPGMCLINKSHWSGAGWDGSFAWASSS